MISFGLLGGLFEELFSFVCDRCFFNAAQQRYVEPRSEVSNHKEDCWCLYGKRILCCPVDWQEVGQLPGFLSG